jgi:hypothetical protein
MTAGEKKLLKPFHCQCFRGFSVSLEKSHSCFLPGSPLALGLSLILVGPEILTCPQTAAAMRLPLTDLYTSRQLRVLQCHQNLALWRVQPVLLGSTFEEVFHPIFGW